LPAVQKHPQSVHSTPLVTATGLNTGPGDRLRIEESNRHIRLSNQAHHHDDSKQGCSVPARHDLRSLCQLVILALRGG
jgi:hypothetical protein